MNDLFKKDVFKMLYANRIAQANALMLEVEERGLGTRDILSAVQDAADLAQDVEGLAAQFKRDGDSTAAAKAKKLARQLQKITAELHQLTKS